MEQPTDVVTGEAALDRAAEAIRANTGTLALACHHTPDGDALGSMLAIHHLATAAGQKVVSSWPEPFVVGPHYTYLPGLDLVTKPVDFPSAPEVMVTFDCGSLGRLGELAASAEAADRLVVVDHHATNDFYGSINLVDADAAASAVLVYRLAQRLAWPLTRDAALPQHLDVALVGQQAEQSLAGERLVVDNQRGEFSSRHSCVLDGGTRHFVFIEFECPDCWISAGVRSRTLWAREQLASAACHVARTPRHS